MSKKVIWIILDSVGIGASEDAADFGDEGADTLGHIYEEYFDKKNEYPINLQKTQIWAKNKYLYLINL